MQPDQHMVKLTLPATQRQHKSLKKLREPTQSLAILRLTLLLFPWDPGPRCLRSIAASWQWPLRICSSVGCSVLFSLCPAALQHASLAVMDKLPCSLECQVVLTPAHLHPRCSCCTLKGFVNSVTEHSPWLAPALLPCFFVHIGLA